MRYKLEDYEQFTDRQFLQRIENLAKPLQDKHVVHVNSTYYGGGVAEILTSLIMLLNDAGVKTGWRLLKGSEEFFSVTKQMHNGLQGLDAHLSNREKSVYINTNQTNSVFTHLDHHDLVMIHDPQPLPLINYCKKEAPWIWRCHIDLSNPNPLVLNYLKRFTSKYDAAVFSTRQFARNLGMPHRIIAPAIDPLDIKNVEIPQKEIDRQLKKFDIPQDKPIIAQVSRFDRWKDPWGVIDAFGLVKKKVDCRLVLLGSPATDDPEGAKVYEGVLAKQEQSDDIHVISFQSDILVNAVQRASSVIIQNSVREGFGLTVSEALWKEKPVVTRKVGGIPLQVKHGKNGYFATDLHDFARKIEYLLTHKKEAKQMGKYGKAHVQKNFLITRLLEDHLKLYQSVLKR